MSGEKKLRAACAALLARNDRGGCTIPTPKLYPHQWNWDSAFAAIGWSHVDPRRAARELEMLLRGQWDDGMIPSIVFTPGQSYEPGPDQWHTTGAPGTQPGSLVTSITQPPVAATAARMVLETSGGDRKVEETLRTVVAGLDRWHAWFARTRDPSGIGAPAIVHPWESGMDNAPRWDAAMARIDPGKISYRRQDHNVIAADQRPTRYDYDRYFFIVNARARLGFRPPDPATEPLLVTDVAIAAILCRAEEDLAWLGAALGVEVPGAARRRERLCAALEGPLFDAERIAYQDRDVKSGEPVVVEHLASYVPLYAGIVPPPRVAALVERLTDARRYATPFPLPTVPPSEPTFEARRYWRGPVWINLNWLVIEGLGRSGQGDLAGELTSRTLDLVDRSGFFEYFDPMTGQGCGADDFAWTAALTLDLLGRR